MLETSFIHSAESLILCGITIVHSTVTTAIYLTIWSLCSLLVLGSSIYITHNLRLIMAKLVFEILLFVSFLILIFPRYLLLTNEKITLIKTESFVLIGYTFLILIMAAADLLQIIDSPSKHVCSCFIK